MEEEQQKIIFGVTQFEDRNGKNFQEDKGYYEDEEGQFYRKHGAVYFVVLDGHGGHLFAEYYLEALKVNVEERYNKNFNKEKMMKFMHHIIKDTNEQILNQFNDKKLDYDNYKDQGACICLCFIRFENNQRVVYSANLGDTRSVLLMNNFQAKRLSYDHKASDIFLQRELNKDPENELINFTENGIRLKMILMVCKAVGDFTYEQGDQEDDHENQKLQKMYSGMDNTYVKRKIIQDKHKFLIIASDGLYDNISDDIELSYWMNKSTGKVHRLAQVFCENAVNIKEQVDNVLVIAVQLQQRENLFIDNNIQ